jgi:phage tail sheath protein FI
VYIIEQPSGSHVITGVSTSVTAFVGAARKGPGDEAIALSSFADYVRTFGDVMDVAHPMGHSVAHFFANGGSNAIIVRALGAGAKTAAHAFDPAGDLILTLTARSRGGWANGTAPTPAAKTGIFATTSASTNATADHFKLEITQWTPGVSGGSATVLTTETFDDLSMSPANSRYVEKIVNASSLLVTASVSAGPPNPAPAAGTSTGTVTPGGDVHVSGKTLRLSIDQGPATDFVFWPGENPATGHDLDAVCQFMSDNGWPVDGSHPAGPLVLTSKTSDLDSAVVVGLTGVNDASEDFGLGLARGGTEVSASAPYRPAAVSAALAGGDDGSPVAATDIVSATAGEGMLALQTLDFPRFNLLCLPGVTTADTAEINDALDYCRRQNAFLVVDPAGDLNPTQLEGQANLVRALGAHGAVYWPRLITPDSDAAGLPPSGAVAGVMARTDAARGVWKAPAGLAAGVAGPTGLASPTNDDVSGELNHLGLNVLRSFPGSGIVVWGARTLAGSDVPGGDFKYVPVRRLTDYLSASLYLGTQFAVFEPNDPELWGQLRLAVGGFMRGLFRQGAFQQSEKHAESDSFFVICDSTVNPQTEIDAGRVNVVVGFAPLKPAEFVVITITQLSQAGA